ncbi:hypothetical protein TSAR_010984 [Trichomalopsis sarcophagae]|uniref:Uncharacterized protein n=1 Tax=Trichomalopsis sarcophagae TaxID=543379 RepID=A0A232EWU5_9HYME|nr:hypothetical protein TSAR_010984 [Trichomalopsis sarcophagae]
MSHTRATPWLLGIFKQPGKVMSCDSHTSLNTLNACIEIEYLIVLLYVQMALYTGWFLTFVSSAFCILSTRSFTQESYVYNLPWEVTFAALVRTAWAFAICWIIYASLHDSAGKTHISNTTNRIIFYQNYEGFISTILSWKYFLLLSKTSCIAFTSYILLS